jgi:ADP-ribose pyrophosphatase
MRFSSVLPTYQRPRVGRFERFVRPQESIASVFSTAGERTPCGSTRLECHSMTIRKISSRAVYSNRWMTVREHQIERADGSPGIYGVIEKPDFVLVIPIQKGGPIEKDQVYLVEQYRLPVAGRFAEFPQGSWEQKPGADPLDIARGELREETGLLAGKMGYVGHLFVAYGMSNQGFHIFLATELSQGERSLEKEEQDLVVKRVAIAEFEEMILRGEIKDAASIAAWALLAIKNRRELGSHLRVG